MKEWERLVLLKEQQRTIKKRFTKKFYSKEDGNKTFTF